MNLEQLKQEAEKIESALKQIQEQIRIESEKPKNEDYKVRRVNGKDVYLVKIEENVDVKTYREHSASDPSTSMGKLNNIYNYFPDKKDAEKMQKFIAASLKAFTVMTQINKGKVYYGRYWYCKRDLATSRGTTNSNGFKPDYYINRVNPFAFYSEEDCQEFIEAMGDQLYDLYSLDKP